MIEPIRSRDRRPKPTRFKPEAEKLRTTAREKMEQFQRPGNFVLPSGDELKIDEKTDGRVEMNLRRDEGSEANVDFSRADQNEARLNSVNESESERKTAEKGPQYTDLGRGELVDMKF